MLLTLVLLAALIGLALLIAALRSGSFRVERSIRIAAPAAHVFAHVDDLHRFQEWSPWAKLDPHATLLFEGPVAGIGASFSWTGNHQVGEGRATIVESRPAELVRMRLEYVRPCRDTNTAEFTFRAEASETVVTWSVYGHRRFVFRLVGLVLNFDRLIGGIFDKGLASLKILAETKAAPTSPAIAT